MLERIRCWILTEFHFIHLKKEKNLVVPQSIFITHQFFMLLRVFYSSFFIKFMIFQWKLKRKTRWQLNVYFDLYFIHGVGHLVNLFDQFKAWKKMLKKSNLIIDTRLNGIKPCSFVLEWRGVESDICTKMAELATQSTTGIVRMAKAKITAIPLLR